jgi:DNA repair protein SbcD/Mre11
MILLHSADWHLGKRLENHARLPEQVLILGEICDLADQIRADVILLAGDLFDNFQPSNEAAALFYQTMSRLSREGSRPVLVIAGNHDSPDFLSAPSVLAIELGVILVGQPRQHIPPFTLNSGVSVLRSAPGFLELALPGHPPLRVLATPYANALRLRTTLDPEHPEAALSELLHNHWRALADAYLDDQGCNVLMTHLYMADDPEHPEPEPEDERPILYIGGIPALSTAIIPEQIQYTALGHLHRPHLVPHPAGVPVVYSGSPLSYSFAEARQQKQVVRVDLEPGQAAKWSFLPLNEGRPLLRFRTVDPDEATRFLAENPQAFVELTMVSQTYLASEVKNRLEAAHPRVFIIPESNEAHIYDNQEFAHVRLDHLREVFEAYFRERHGQDPDPALLDLFSELLQEAP